MAPTTAQLIRRHLHQLTTRNDSSLPDHELVRLFVLTRDERAFAALVDRHAAMVLGLCRSILHNGHDAEDIFQAAFLVLARKAASLRKGESVGSFLYAVAYRLARKARVRDGKRRQRERQAAPREAVPMDDVTWGELRGILHDEVSKLPEKWRAAVVLCYWEGRTHEQAAQQLGCARTTVKDRLARARELLRTRLARRGLALPAAWFAVSLAGGTSSAAVPTELVQATVRGAVQFSTGGLPAEIVSAQAVTCARSTLQTMFLGKLKLGVLLALLLGVISGGAGWAVLQKPPAEAPFAQTKPPLKSAEQPLHAKQVEARRDSQGDPLPPGALLRLGTIRFRPGGQVQSLAFLPGGKAIVSTGFKGIYFWDAATGKELRRIKLSSEGVGPFTLSSDGKILAALCEGAIQLWEASTGKELHKLETNATCLAFSHDGRKLASADQKITLSIWDWRDKKEERRIPSKQWRIERVGFGPDDRSVYAWDYQNLSTWDVASGEPLQPFRYPDPKKIGVFSTYLDRLVLSPDGKRVARSIFKQPVRVYEAGTWSELQHFQAGKVRVEAFTPDGQGLLVSGEEGTILWDVTRGKEMYRIADGGVPAFSPDGRVLALCGYWDGAICLYDAVTGKRLRPLPGHEGSVDALAFSPDGRSIATRAFSDGKVHLWDARTGKPLYVFSGPATHETQGYSLAFAPDGASLAWGDWGGRIYLGDSRTGRELHRWIVDKEVRAVQSVRFSPNGRSLSTASYSVGKHPGDSSRSLLLQTWEAATGKEISRFETAFRMEGDPPVVSHDGKMVLMNEGGRWTLRDAIRGRELARLQIADTIGRLWFFAFSPDDRTLAGSTLQNNQTTLRLWETASGAELLTIPVQGSSDGRVAVSSDGRLLALGGSESIRLWDVATGQEVLQLRGHGMTVHSLRFAPDGKTLASGLSDTTVLIWDLAPLGPRAAPSDPRELVQLWNDLGSIDGPKAYRALWSLAAGERSIDLFRKHLRPATEAETAELRQLLDDLNSDRFQTRERASKELERRRAEAGPILEQALAAKPALEVRRRIENILRRPRRLESPELLRRLRAVQVLERLATPEARQLLDAIAQGERGALLTREAKAALQRIKPRPAASP
ncbi:MAG TPA: sigma-70 family RNA polymerase sigma factor [Gemmataceae bacterium]|jgi:RNA polymerase sigma factor (sigma-70 family)